jgi:hypothetical protein
MAFGVRGLVGRYTKLLNGATPAVRQTAQSSLAVAQVEPEWGALLEAGVCFVGGNTTAAAGIAPNTSVQTTTAPLCLVNNESAGGKSYVIFGVNASLLSGTAAAAGSICLAVTQSPLASLPIAASANTIFANLAGNSTITSKATFKTSQTLPGTPYWMTYKSDNSLAASALFGAGIAGTMNMKAFCAVPPGCGLGIGVWSGAGTSPLFSISVFWAELVLDNQ